MQATQTKLAEAAFFWRKLTDVGSKLFSSEPEAFGFYLSAFVSAGRSVSLALQAEHKMDYDAWFHLWAARLSDEQRALLEYFNAMRVTTIHKLGIELSHQTVEMTTSEYLFAAAREGADIQIWHGPPGTPAPPQYKIVRTFELGGTQADVLAACRFYMELIADLVNSFTAQNPDATA